MGRDGLPGVVDVPHTRANFGLAFAFYIAPAIPIGLLIYASLERHAPVWTTIFFLSAWVTVARVFTTTRLGPYLGGFAAIIGIGLYFVVVPGPGPRWLWGDAVRAVASSAIRDVRGTPTPVLCVRVLGIPDQQGTAQISGPPLSEPIRFAFDLGSDGVFTKPLVVPRAGAYTIDVKSNDKRDFVEIKTHLPTDQQTPRAFSCS
jgi:hypothetical protein